MFSIFLAYLIYHFSIFLAYLIYHFSIFGILCWQPLAFFHDPSLATLLYIRADAPVIQYIGVKHVALFNHREKIKERQYNKGGFLKVVRRKPGYNVNYFSVGANCLVRCKGLI